MNIVKQKNLLCDRSNGPARARIADRVLVERDHDGAWSPVLLEERAVSNDELRRDFALWKDQEVTSGHLFWKKVERPKNDQIEPDEIVTVAQIASQPVDLRNREYYPSHPDYHFYNPSTLSQVELEMTRSGGTVNTEWKAEPMIMSYPYILENPGEGHYFLGPSDW